MKKHTLRVFPSSKFLPKKEQLAWKIASMALSPTPISKEVEEEVVSRIIDNAAVATASLKRPAALHARDQALSHPRKNGATVFGLDSKYRFDAEWSAWANGVAVRELDFHDTFLAADYSHPADNIPPVLSVAEQTGKNGKEVLEAIVVAYETHISLVKAICLHKHKVDHIAHLAPAQVAGLGVLLSMKKEALYQAIGQAVHLSFTTRQSRKGEISSWKAYAPAFAGKMAIESVDRALRGETSPSPIYEGEDSVVAQVVYKLKTAYRNGTTHIVLDPLDFLSRLASLIPRPRVHLIRFHGVFAPHFKCRSLIVPQPSLFEKTSHKEKKKPKSYSMGWAKTLKRVFDIDIQTCPKCGGQIKIISSILNPQVIKKILIHLGENAKVPELAPPRGPPEIEEWLPELNPYQ